MNQPTQPRSTQSVRGQASRFARASHRRDVDALMDRYVSWREACAAVALAYERSKGPERLDREVAFGIYVAALDREEAAADAYESAVAQVVAPPRAATATVRPSETRC